MPTPMRRIVYKQAIFIKGRGNGFLTGKRLWRWMRIVPGASWEVLKSEMKNYGKNQDASGVLRRQAKDAKAYLAPKVKTECLVRNY